MRRMVVPEAVMMVAISAGISALGMGIAGIALVFVAGWPAAGLLILGGWVGWNVSRLLRIDNGARRALVHWHTLAFLAALILVVASLVNREVPWSWMVAALWMVIPLVLLHRPAVAGLYATGFSEAHPPVRLTEALAAASHTSVTSETDYLLQVNRLRTLFFTDDGPVKAVDGVNLRLRAGQTLGIVGESGCGKSVTGLSIMRLLSKPGRTVAGEVLLDGRNLLTIGDDEMEDVRGNDISMIFQEPMTALNPVLRVGDQIADVIRRHMGVSDRVARARVVELLEKVHLAEPKQRVQDYPHQLSGGMRQRVMIAMALACSPRLLIADEPTTALDVTIQAQILELLGELKKTENMSMIIISHDLGVIAEMADYVSVMYAGKIVEEAPVAQLFTTPQHPYTQGLLASIPGPANRGKRLSGIGGMVPHPLNLPPGCSFAPRCPYKFEPCDGVFPALEKSGPEHAVACYLGPAGGLREAAPLASSGRVSGGQEDRSE